VGPRSGEVSNRAGQVPAVVAERRERSAGSKDPVEEAVPPSSSITRRSVGTSLATWARRLSSVSSSAETASSRIVATAACPCWVPAADGDRGQLLAGPSCPRCAEHRRRRPTSRRRVQRGHSPFIHDQAEAATAELESLVRAERQVGRLQMVELATAQPFSAGREVAGEDQQPLIAAEPVGQPVDQRGGVALGVMGVVDDERAPFRFERRERGFDRVVGVVTCAGHPRCGCLEAGMSDT